ncbi:MAG: T9SS type A sorting domain-containing protein [Lewinellaceae bacterium]|nr:T9SS type A sorting domain-containing protein [Lewinellaceae bacterium]
MKKQLLFFLGVLWCSWSTAQSLSPEVVASSGEHYATGTAQMSWTLGEAVIETYATSGAVLTQGFHQTQLMVVAVNNPAAAFRVSVFPNPTAGMVSIEAPETVELTSLSLSDAGGRVVTLRQTLPQQAQHSLDLSGFPAGTYYLRLRAKDQNAVQTFKIIKSN